MMEERHTNKAQWWVMTAMWGVILTGGSAMASYVNSRITKLEETVNREIPTLREFEAVRHRLERIEAKIDHVLEMKTNG